jgi:hypothetical protein
MSLNATAAAFHSSPRDAYASIDFSSLSWIEKQWAAWYINIGNLVVATGLMSFLLHEVSLPLSIKLYLVIPVPIPGCLLWPRHPLDYYRRHTVFPQVEASTEQSPNSSGTMGVHQAGSILAFYRGNAIGIFLPQLCLD